MINFAFSVPIKISEASGKETGKKTLQINGDAITEGTTRNKVKYTREELMTSAKSLMGKPILDTHRQESIKGILGRVTSSTFEGNCIKFSADIMDRDAIEMIQDGRIQNVSIGAKVDDLIKEEVEGSEDIMVAKGIDFLELSLCSVPGDPNASISSALSESYKVTKEPFMRKGKSYSSDIMETKRTKEADEPAPAPVAAPAPAPVPVVDGMTELKTMIQQMMAMLQQVCGGAGTGAEKLKAESSEKIKQLQEQLAQLTAQSAPRGKGVISEDTTAKEQVVVNGNITRMIQENGKTFCVEKTAGGKASFWYE